MSVRVLLIAVYCCFLWVCPSSDVIKNRIGVNFNQQLRKKEYKHVSIGYLITALQWFGLYY